MNILFKKSSHKAEISRGSKLRRLDRKNDYFLNRHNILNILTLLILLYFIFHSIYGSRGVLAYSRLKTELQQSYLQLNLLKAERLENENRTKLMRPDSLDRDMVDQQIREILGFSKADEKIFRK